MSAEPTAPPQIAIFQMMNGLWVSQIASAVAQLAVPDAIAAGKNDVDTLAAECGADPAALHRLLRAAATLGLVQETAPRTFALTPMGETLRSGVPGSMRDILIAETALGHWLPWGKVVDAVRTGKPTTQATLGMSGWEYYAANPEEGQCFARGMGNLSAVAVQEVAAVYNVGDARTVVDVGGSEGVLLRGLLRGAPEAQGILFDRPEIIDYAKQKGDPEFAGRLQFVGGDFFKEVPGGGDVYTLKHILHDWSDDECAAILKNVHRAAKEGSRLVLVEFILPDDGRPSPVTLMDINMMVMVGGRERTADEFRTMLAAGGFEVERIVATSGMFHVIEARRV
jgi:ubiquinone/menaquinone biosynthesis C-methylase UbiE